MITLFATLPPNVKTPTLAGERLYVTSIHNATWYTFPFRQAYAYESRSMVPSALHNHRTCPANVMTCCCSSGRHTEHQGWLL